MISEYVRTRGAASVAELARAFEVSNDTVRRDLAKLEDHRLLSRTHGGAVAKTAPAADLHSVAERSVQQAAAKRAIGSAAARLVREGETLLINGGSTTLAAAKALGERPDIALVTCSPLIAQEVGDAMGRGIFLLGGRWYPAFGVVVGPVTLPGASQLRADVLILGVAGISTDGISIANIEEAEMLGGMIAAASRVVVVADASKFDRRAFALLDGLKCVDVLVADRAPTGELAAALEQAEVQVVIA